MDNIRAAVDRVMAMGLEVRKDIYADASSVRSENISMSSYHQPLEPPTDHFNIPSPTPAEAEESPELSEEKAAQSSVRCVFCPEPGLVPLVEKIEHMASHVGAVFSCAACSGKRKFEGFEEVVRHIHTLHSVTDGEMVLETIVLPTVQHGLKVFKCGVKNCEKIFVAQPESVLVAHMERTHGAYYVRVGRGKYLVRQCRICGEERQFSSDLELSHHITNDHPAEQFGQMWQSESDGEDHSQPQSESVEIKQENVDPEFELVTSNYLGKIITPTARAVVKDKDLNRDSSYQPSQVQTTSPSTSKEKPFQSAASSSRGEPSKKQKKSRVSSSSSSETDFQQALIRWRASTPTQSPCLMPTVESRVRSLRGSFPPPSNPLRAKSQR